MRHLILILAAVCAVTFWASPASADPITFIHSGSGSGSLAGDPFDVSAFTITALGDTSNRISYGPGIFTLPHDAASIDIDGVGTLTFTEDTLTFVNNGNEVVGFSRPGSDMFNGPVDPAFATWDMLSSIGPISGSGALMQWWAGMQTDLGLLIFNDDGSMFDYSTWDIPTTFEAIVNAVPLPGAVVLGALGLGVAGRLCRRRTA